MSRIFFFVLLFAAGLWFSDCNKNVATNESVLYGTWIKGSNAGDTLRFFKKDDKNILAYNLSFNASLPAPTETEYIYQNGKPGIKNYLATPNNFFIIQSFEWKQTGRKFELQGSELFPFMASTMVRFTYHKIQ